MPRRPLPTTPPAAETIPQSEPDVLARICDVIAAGPRVLITSHARPDGDSIGSQVALALALDRIGKPCRIVNRDPVPAPFRPFPGTGRIEVASRADGDGDTLVVLECSDLARAGVAGLERYPAVNIDHHAGNTGFGVAVWVDESAAACGEMVADLIDALGVPWSPEIATHLYVAILTDTGSFRHSGISARTFEICRRVAAAGVDPAAVSRQVFDSGSTGRLKLMGAILVGMRLEGDGRLAVLELDDRLLAETGATPDDADGLINLPLSSVDVQAVTMFKPVGGTGELRVSLRSKGDVDVRAVASRYGGGGHRNAAGFTAPGHDAVTRAQIVAAVASALDQPRAPSA
jgi:phosphoesterase RecJ-like protein